MEPPFRLEPWHVGAVVADLEQAILEYRMLGAVGFSDAANFDFDTYDAATGDIVREQLDVVYVELAAGRGSVELICPRNAYGPQARLLRQRPGLSHTAYWCEEFIQAANWLLDCGAQLVLAPLHGVPGSHAELASAPLDDVLAAAQTCYLRLRSGGLIELNTVESRLGMPLMWGNSILDRLPVPQAWRA
ncbi:Glyoxalase/Bleomycin resistance protein/Dioxygenase superfamily protein [Sphingopyxis flava]|uniref:Glyoxalase/Bleomycin resistance protein/Dioxygenase superfamily protein n=2 Tax=Sphingopyxis flava TaxID=1507287 RepID=A0A1T5FLX7_9SPHN|nr:Glyoxalase/Bleomycin resistance protein/Dioxygenase superfamily protein [Sphingopyxis flava]